MRKVHINRYKICFQCSERKEFGKQFFYVEGSPLATTLMIMECDRFIHTLRGREEVRAEDILEKPYDRAGSTGTVIEYRVSRPNDPGAPALFEAVFWMEPSHIDFELKDDASPKFNFSVENQTAHA